MKKKSEKCQNNSEYFINKKHIKATKFRKEFVTKK